MNHTGSFWFESPGVLLLLVVIPFLFIWFLRQQRQYWHDAFAFSQVSLLEQLQHQPKLVMRQRMLPMILLLAMTISIIGLAQPVWKARIMTQKSNMMLVLDISLSMQATDIAPSRLEAAKTTAIHFVDALPREVEIGLAFFAGNTYLMSPPITDHDLITSYLKSLQPQDLRPGTAIGDALLTAMKSLQATQQNKDKDHSASGTIVLLTDGENNLGSAPNIAVEQAIRQKVTIFTVGMGEETGAYIQGDIFTRLDEASLQSIAEETGGQYYRARKFQDFHDIFTQIAQKSLHVEERPLPLMPWCLGLSSFLLLGGFILGVRFRRF